MKRLSLRDVVLFLKEKENYCIRINEFTRQINLVKFNIDCIDEVIGYITFNQFMKMDLTIGIKELHIKSFIYDYYTLKK